MTFQPNACLVSVEQELHSYFTQLLDNVQAFKNQSPPEIKCPPRVLSDDVNDKDNERLMGFYGLVIRIINKSLELKKA